MPEVKAILIGIGLFCFAIVAVGTTCIGMTVLATAVGAG